MTPNGFTELIDRVVEMGVPRERLLRAIDAFPGGYGELEQQSGAYQYEALLKLGKSCALDQQLEYLRDLEHHPLVERAHAQKGALHVQG